MGIEEKIMNKSISVIIPFLNEAENIPVLVSTLNTFFKNSEYQSEVIFVNDGSTDSSLKLLKESAHNSYHCKIISLSKNFGSHSALRAGILHASCDYITFMYADLQDPLDLVNKLKAECDSGNDIAWASRSSTEGSFFERAFSKIYCRLMKKYAISIYPQKGFDVVMFNKKVQTMINNNIEGNSSLFLQILMLGFKQSSIEYQKQSRKLGVSKWTLRKKIKLVIDSFVAFSYAPIRFVTISGIFLFFAGLIWTAYIIFRKLMYNDLDQGWPALVSILTIGFGITNISLGIIAEYLWRTLDSSRKRPVFVIDEIIELNKL